MTKVMLLAAGRGDRMRPLTDNTPKPLLKLNESTTLIEAHIKRLNSVGLNEIVINIAWLGHQIVNYLGDGSRYGVNIQYSDEADTALETAGGIINALDLLGSEPFIVINADIYTNYDFSLLRLQDSKLAQLVLVPNPDFHPEGDFYIKNNVCHPTDGEKFTFSGIAIYHPNFFKGLTVDILPLGPLIRSAIAEFKINAEVYYGEWSDVGTPERLHEIQRSLQNNLGS